MGRGAARRGAAQTSWHGAIVVVVVVVVVEVVVVVVEVEVIVIVVVVVVEVEVEVVVVVVVVVVVGTARQGGTPLVSNCPARLTPNLLAKIRRLKIPRKLPIKIIPAKIV